jgi:RNA polymerase sigma factor (sigma-70 family)
MSTSVMNEVVQCLRSAALRGEGADLTDGQLLECFVSRQEGTALEALVRRHGPMVWGVCQRTLRNEHDAEDAFQATFLVLIRKAASIYPRAKVGNWLYGVAHQTALKARATRMKRQIRERSVRELPEPVVTAHDLWSELEPLLDREVSRLPEKYRTVIVLCELEGKSGKEAARQLGCPEGTVASRLSRARTMLAKRLSHHSLAVMGGALAIVLSQKAASAAVPISVMTSTIKIVTCVAAGKAGSNLISVPVAALAKGVLKTMLLNKLKTAAVVLLILGVITFGGAVLTHDRAAAQDTTKGGQEATRKDDAGKPPAGEQKNAVDQPHNFRNLQRLAAVFSDFKYPEKAAASSITIWTQSGAQGGAWQTLEVKTIELAKALNAVFATWEGFDLENVAIIRSGDRTIQFVDVKDNVASGKPSSVSLNRGDLVIVLKDPRKK